MIIQKFLQILIQVLKNKCELSVSMQNIYQSYDVWMLELFQQGDLSDCGWRDAFIFTLQFNFFKGIDVAGINVFCSVYNTVSSFSDLLEFFVFINLGFNHFFTKLI